MSAAATAAALWSYAAQPRRVHAAYAVVPIQDGKTIDFSGGEPAITDSPADRAAVSAAVKDMDSASRDVSFPADPTPKK